MAILRKLYPILLLPILAGCEEVCDIDVAQKPVLCVSGLMTAGEPMEVTVEKSRLYTDSYDKSEVTDATVSIYVNGQLKQDSYAPDEGDVIKVVAESKTLGQAIAEVAIPKAVHIKEMKWEAYDAKMDWMSAEADYCMISFKLKAQLTIADPEGDKYYKFVHSSSAITDNDDYMGRDLFYANGLQYDAEPLFSEHIGVFESIMGSSAGDAYGYAFFTDRQFAGKTYTLNILFDNCQYQGRIEDMPDCECTLSLRSISPSYYNWMSYNWKLENGTITDLSDYGFGDPVWGYSNCTTGAGIVAAQSMDDYDIDLTDYIRDVITKYKKQ